MVSFFFPDSVMSPDLRTDMRFYAPATIHLLARLTASCAAAVADDHPQVFRGARLLTVSHGEIAGGDLVVRGGKIVAVGKQGEVEIPEGAEMHDMIGKVIIPGLVDTH